MNEAFLAIVSISAFAKLLVDEIAKKLNYVAAKKDVADQRQAASNKGGAMQPTIDRAVAALLSFAKHYSTKQSTIPIESEAQLMGALSGFLSSVLPDLETTTGRVFRTDKPHYVDMVVSNQRENVIIELKRGFSASLLNAGLHQVQDYMKAAGSRQGILFLYSDKTTEYSVVNRRHITGPGETLLALEPIL